MSEAFFSIEDLTIEFRKPRSLVDAAFGRAPSVLRAVDAVSLSIRKGETLGLVGESGSGKTTVGRAALGVYPPTGGRIALRGEEIASLARTDRKALARRIQMVFQDPYNSLNPRLSVRETLSEVLAFHSIVRSEAIESEIAKLLDLVGLTASLASRRPHQLSGGQRQRVGLARALAVRPEMLVLDEPVSALDVSIQAQILNLLKDLHDELELTMLFIAHELGVVRHMSDRIAVMYLGRIMEIAETAEIFEAPKHPYTVSLLAAMPSLSMRKRERSATFADGDIPSPLEMPTGCRFRTRCPYATERCLEEPPMVTLSLNHAAACHHPRN